MSIPARIRNELSGLNRARRMFPGLLAVSSCLLLLLYTPASAEILRILHTNDMHARLLPFRTSGGDTLGGFARLATLVQRERAEASGVSILVDAGDAFQGTPFFNFYRGEAELTCMSAIGYEAMALGNHELDEGAENLLKMAANFAEFPILSANVFIPPAMQELWWSQVRQQADTTAARLSGKKYWQSPEGIFDHMAKNARRTLDLVPIDVEYVFRRKGDARIALIGLTTETLPNILTKRAFEGITVKPVRERLEEILPYAHERADLIILLSHCGLEADSITAATISGIDVIISGHDHQRQTPPKLVRNSANDNGIGGTLLVEAGSGGTRLGRLDLKIEDGRILSYEGSLIPVTPDVPEDSTVAAIVDQYRAGLELLVSEVIVESPGEMSDDGVMDGPTVLGNLVSDYLRRAANADIALQNGGGIRASLHAGPVRIGAVYELLPFDNTIVTMNLTGLQVKEMCREAAAKRGDGGFGCVSGISFDAEPGGPENILVGGAPLEGEALYRVAINSFTAGGGDGYTAFDGGTDRQDSGVSLRDAVIDLMRKDRRLEPDAERRIRFPGQ